MVLFSAAVLATGVAMAANPTKVTETRMSSAGLRAERMNQQFFNKTAVTLRTNDKSNVVASKQLKDGSSINLVKGNDGHLYKVLNRSLRASDKITPSKSRINAPAVMKADENATLFEGFESYEGQTSRGWVPEGWSQESKTRHTLLQKAKAHASCGKRQKAMALHPLIAALMWSVSRFRWQISQPIL